MLPDQYKLPKTSLETELRLEVFQLFVLVSQSLSRALTTAFLGEIRRTSFKVDKDH
jgi:hypothetical protein